MNPYWYPPPDPYYSQPSSSDWSNMLGWIFLAGIICAAIYFLTNNSYDSTQTGNSTIAITINSKKKRCGCTYRFSIKKYVST